MKMMGGSGHFEVIFKLQEFFIFNIPTNNIWNKSMPNVITYF